MHSCILDLDFGGFCEIFGFGVFFLMIYDHELHSISIFTMFHAFRCVPVCWKLYAGRFRFGFKPSEIPLRCPIVFIQEFYSNMHGIDTSVPQFTMVLQGTCIVVTSDLVSEILHIPWVAHLDYPGYQCLRIVSKDELLFHFCETPSIWGERQTTHARALQKVRDSLIWWWHLFLLHCLTITPSQSLVLNFCCPS